MPIAGPVSVVDILAQAVSHHQAGRLGDADKLYRVILEVQPQHPDANHNIGVLARQVGKPELALPYFKAALKANPSQGQFWLSYIDALIGAGDLDAARQVLAEGRQKGLSGPDVDALSARAGATEQSEERLFAAAVAHHKAGRHEEAVTQYKALLALKPGHAAAHNNLGAALRELGRLAESEASYRRALVLEPDFADARSNLGNLLRDLGRLEESEESYRRAVAIKPDFADAHSNLGNLLREIGQLEESEASCRRALAINPDFAVAHSNLGNVLRDLGRLEESASSYRRALAIKPDFAEVHNNLGNALCALGRLEESEASYRRAVATKPDFVVAHNSLGNILCALGRLEESEESYRRAVAIRPDFADAHNNLGNVLCTLGRLEESEASYHRALAIKPDLALALSNLGVLLQQQSRIDAAATCYGRALALDPNLAVAQTNFGSALAVLGEFTRARRHHEIAIGLTRGMSGDGTKDTAWNKHIFTADHDPAADERGIQCVRKSWAATLSRRRSGAASGFPNSREANRKLRIGYVSGDFWSHSASAGFEPVLRWHDRTQFELYLYSNRATDDEDTARFRAYATAFRPVRSLRDDALETMISQDAVDILVDLSGHSTGSRLGVFGRKPAPVQVTAWGYVTGTGLSEVDYLFGDPVAVPSDQRGHFAEQIWDLPCILPFRVPDLDLEPNSLPALDRGHVTFGCINRLIKLWPALPTFARLLEEMPTSRLIVKARELGEAETCERVLRVLAEHGAPLDQVELRGPSSSRDHLATLHDIDIALDPFPQTGGVTTMESLWLGVPVVTMTGRILSSRVAASILTVLGLSHLVAADQAGYIAIARRLAGDLEGLAGLRASLRGRLTASIICDAPRYTAEVEKAYRAMWRRWCKGA